ncbi:MAG: biotin/lipoate A/B protein ligase family protein [Actinomycetaceae bacterium]|nr:biotin/lipoate A/B protein ligase family protein [Actinomycetaceae bacterium]
MHGEYKVPGGKLVVVDLDVDDGRLVNVRVSGDFFLEPDSALERITGAIEGMPHTATASEIAGAIEKNLALNDVLFGLTPHGVGMAVRRAAGHALDWNDIDFEVIHGPSVDPQLNCTMDETLVEDVAAGKRKPFMRIWEWNAPQVVIGSFQSYTNEINQAGVDKYDITVTRRITGGGAMFMEPGNCVTYSLVIPTALVDGLSFAESYAFLDRWCMEALEKCGVKARYVPLNDIASEQGKIGGAAQKRFANGYMVHHVTMAYDIDANKMMECLRIGREKLKDKGTRSAVKRVDPMRSQTGLSREAIIDIFLEHFRDTYGASDGVISESDLEAARQRAAEKFSTPEWTHRIP